MSRTMEFEHDSESGNSFLDVITASIGILIILVLVTGQHARQLAEALLVESQENSTVAAARAKEANVEQEARELAAQMTRVQAELAEQHARRGQLSTLVAAIEFLAMVRHPRWTASNAGQQSSEPGSACFSPLPVKRFARSPGPAEGRTG